MEIYQELLETSLTEKRGLTFFLQGQTISGIVVEILADKKAVVLQSQMYSRIIVRLENVAAVAIG
ncbi:MAG: hypothetical protein ABI954_07345 [Pyrinomonadaceae bacterium]